MVRVVKRLPQQSFPTNSFSLEAVESCFLIARRVAF
jgi:hypothetical protein